MRSLNSFTEQANGGCFHKVTYLKTNLAYRVVWPSSFVIEAKCSISLQKLCYVKYTRKQYCIDSC